MTRKTYRTVYMKFRGIRPTEGYIANGVRYYVPLDNWGVVRLSSAIRKHFESLFTSLEPFGFNKDQFLNALMAKYGEYYIPVNPRARLRLYSDGYSVEGDSIVGDSAANGGVAYVSSSSNNTLQIEYRAATVALNGKTNKTTGVIQELTNIPAASTVYVYADVITLYDQIMTIINRQLNRAVELVNAYTAVPIVNETDADTTTVTPNLTTNSIVQFNPVYASAESTASHQITTSKGSQTTVAKRANGVSAKAQADIVRNLPNIFNDCINEIGSLLTDPRTIQDMRDWGLALGDYIDEEEED